MPFFFIKEKIHVTLLTQKLIEWSFAPAIEDDYGGPKLEDGKVTLTFMKQLMDWFKDQKKLHRKCAYQVTQSIKIYPGKKNNFPKNMFL